MSPKMAMPRVGDVIETSIHADNDRAGSIFLIVNKAKSRKTLWAKLLCCRVQDSVKLWQAENLPDRPIQIKFGFTPEEAVDRLGGRLEYAKSFTILMPSLSKFNPDVLKEFNKQQIVEMQIEFENVNFMLEVEPADPERSPSPQAVII